MYIAKEEITNQKVLEIYRAAFMEAEMDDDGDIRVRVEGTLMIARAHESKPFFVLTSLFGMRDGVTRQQALELANRFNDNMIMVRCCIPETPTPVIWFDHWTMTEGGISAEEIVRLTQRFPRVVRDGIHEYDTEKLVN